MQWKTALLHIDASTTRQGRLHCHGLLNDVFHLGLNKRRTNGTMTYFRKSVKVINKQVFVLSSATATAPTG